MQNAAASYERKANNQEANVMRCGANGGGLSSDVKKVARKKQSVKRHAKADPLGVIRGQNAEAVANVNPRNTVRPSKPVH